MAYARHVYHVYAIRTPSRALVQQSLLAQGIQSAVHYPFPVHLLPAYADLGYREGDFPHAERAAAEQLSLPIYPELPDEAVNRVASAVIESSR